jgi:hypothetical protein
MPVVDNATPFGTWAIPSCNDAGRDLLLIVIAAHFELPGPDFREERLQLLPVQDPPPLRDEYRGAPGASSIRQEGQSPYTKPATDIYVCGDACAPDGKPVSQMDVSIRVGPCRIALRVHGNRTWERGLTVGVTPSFASRFDRMPLVWERAFGGVAAGSTAQRPAFEPRNPIGCGFEINPDAAIGRPVPNIEDPAHAIRGVSDRPRPVGVAPIARHWQPRVSYAGTYDETWRRERAPLWPVDFDERFFCGAVPELQASPHLVGGEKVALDGLHPGGPIRFFLPTLRMLARHRFVDRVVRSTPALDGVVIDAESGRLSMYYRTTVPVSGSFMRHRETLLRLAAPWETGGPR